MCNIDERRGTGWFFLSEEDDIRYFSLSLSLYSDAPEKKVAINPVDFSFCCSANKQEKGGGDACATFSQQSLPSFLRPRNWFRDFSFIIAGPGGGGKDVSCKGEGGGRGEEKDGRFCTLLPGITLGGRGRRKKQESKFEYKGFAILQVSA